jgi:glucose-6-phosphate 1-dehydrogenase
VTADEHTKPAPHVFVLFGATGDLAKRKLFPGLYHLAAADRLPGEYAVIDRAVIPPAPTTSSATKCGPGSTNSSTTSTTT